MPSVAGDAVSCLAETNRWSMNSRCLPFISSHSVKTAICGDVQSPRFPPCKLVRTNTGGSTATVTHISSHDSKRIARTGLSRMGLYMSTYRCTPTVRCGYAPRTRYSLAREELAAYEIISACRALPFASESLEARRQRILPNLGPLVRTNLREHDSGALRRQTVCRAAANLCSS